MNRALALVLTIAIAFSGCSFASQGRDFNNLSTPGGQPVAHQSTTNVAVHLLFKKPLWGDATLEKTVDDFTMKAKNSGAGKVRIVQSKVMPLWFLLPPFTIVLTPTITNVAGDILE